MLLDKDTETDEVGDAPAREAEADLEGETEGDDVGVETPAGDGDVKGHTCLYVQIEDCDGDVEGVADPPPPRVAETDGEAARELETDGVTGLAARERDTDALELTEGEPPPPARVADTLDEVLGEMGPARELLTLGDAGLGAREPLTLALGEIDVVLDDVADCAAQGVAKQSAASTARAKRGAPGAPSRRIIVSPCTCGSVHK